MTKRPSDQPSGASKHPLKGIRGAAAAVLAGLALYGAPAPAAAGDPPAGAMGGPPPSPKGGTQNTPSSGNDNNTGANNDRGPKGSKPDKPGGKGGKGGGSGKDKGEKEEKGGKDEAESETAQTLEEELAKARESLEESMTKEEIIETMADLRTMQGEIVQKKEELEAKEKDLANEVFKKYLIWLLLLQGAVGGGIVGGTFAYHKKKEKGHARVAIGFEDLLKRAAAAKEDLSKTVSGTPSEALRQAEELIRQAAQGNAQAMATLQQVGRIAAELEQQGIRAEQIKAQLDAALRRVKRVK